jgi:Protein of unknown function (DUF3037)
MPETLTPQALRPCAYHVIRYTPNLVRDEWVNIGILLFDPATGRLLQRLVEEPAEFARIRRLHPTADEELLRRLSDDFASQSAGGAITHKVTSPDWNKRSRIPYSSALKKDCWPKNWRPSLTVFITIMWKSHARAARRSWPRETESVPARIRSFGARESGHAWNADCAWTNSPMREIRCAWITDTGTMARADSFKRSRFLAIPARPKFWRLRPMLSARSSTTPNLLLSRKRSHDRRRTPGIASFLACSRPVKSALCRCRGWPNGPIACGPLCLGEAVTKQFRMFSKSCLEHVFGPVFQALFHTSHELVRRRSIHHAMIVAEGQIHHRADGDGIVNDHRPFLNRADP